MNNFANKEIQVKIIFGKALIELIKTIKNILPSSNAFIKSYVFIFNTNSISTLIIGFK